MLSIGKILLPVDFSERSLVAAREAQVLAHRFHSELTVLHVVDDLEQDGGRFEPGGSTLSSLESYLSKQLTDVLVRRVVLEGDPAENIIAYAHSEKVNMILMASHGYGAFNALLLGSVTAKVLAKAKCPVWTSAHTDGAPAPLFRNILCAVDLTPRCEDTLEWACEFATACEARLFVVHALRSLESTDEPYYPGDWLSHAEQQELHKIQTRLGAAGKVLLIGGETHEAVSGQIKKLAADLLVIGRSPQTGDFGDVKSKTYTLMRESSCPVVSVLFDPVAQIHKASFETHVTL
jgi:nucleotide-binding universal stress UspA family protein